MSKTNSLPEEKCPEKEVALDPKRVRSVILRVTELRATYQRYLVKLFSKNNKQVNSKQAVSLLRLSSCEAKDVLKHMMCLEWVKQTKAGNYTLNANTPEEVVDWNTDDPWVTASKVFKPCYIGGWSAAQYWKMTTEYLNGARVYTQKEVDAKAINIKHCVYSLKNTEPDLFFGLDTVIQQGVEVAISDPERTVLDFITVPYTVASGGMDDAQQIFHFYMHSRYKDLKRLRKYILQCHHAPILFKRFGFLMESFYPQEEDFIYFSQLRMTDEYASLDKTPIDNGLAQKWRICLPENWEESNANQTGKQIYEIWSDL